MQKIYSALLTVACILSAGCSSGIFAPPALNRSRNSNQLPDRSVPDLGSNRSVYSERLPWEVWTPFRDLRGNKITQIDIQKGDEFFIRGKRKEALDSYNRARSTELSDLERESVTLRIASSELATEQSAKALRTISEYFKKSGADERAVGPEFALLLAFAYGHHADVNQSLAWFSKVYRQANGHGLGGGVARLGVKKLLYVMPDMRFEELARNWRGDEFVNGVISEERFRRAERGNARLALVDTKSPFWQAPVEVGETPKSYSASEPVVGVLVSLSEKFASLERSTRDGIQLAFDSDKGVPKYTLAVRDVGGGPADASAAVRELSNSLHVGAIVGPLLNDVAKEAASTAREIGTPIITLSKSSDFSLGQGVYRLGATVDSQVNALLSVATGKYKLSKYGIVYPENPNGKEFLQALKKRAAQLNVEVVTEISYGSDNEALLIEAAKAIEKSPVDVLLLPDNIDVSSRFLSTLSPSFRKRVRTLGTATWDNPTKIANSQSLFEGAVFVSPFFALSSRGPVKDFVASYKAKFGTTPNFLAAQGFDAATLVISALRKARDEGSSFTDAVKYLPPYDGLTGFITVDDKGDFKRELRVIEVTKDGLAEVLTSEESSRTE